VAVERPQNGKGTQEVENEKAVEIPLDQIIGLGRYGLRGLEPELFVYRDTPEKVKHYSTPEGLEEARAIKLRAEKESLVLPIERVLLKLPTRKEAKPGPGFAIEGNGKTALRGIYDVLVKGDKPIDEFAAGREVSIVFFTHPTQPAVRFDRITLHNGTFDIRYSLVPRAVQSIRWTLALIPCGKLPVGTYDVEMIRSSNQMGDDTEEMFNSIERGVEKHIVCQPFSFSIVEKTD
jgi:hypothetical protein